MKRKKEPVNIGSFLQTHPFYTYETWLLFDKFHHQFG